MLRSAANRIFGAGADGNPAELEPADVRTIIQFDESVDDRVAALLAAGTNITITYNDASNTLTIASTAGGLSGTGSVDNAALRADGTGGSSLQSSLMTIADNGAIAIPGLSFASRSITLGTNFGWAVNGDVQLWLHAQGSYVSATNASQVSYRGGVQLTFASNMTFPLNGDDVGIVRDASGTLRISDASSGLGDLRFRNIGLNGSISAGGGVGIAYIGNATTVPSTNPTNGGVLYCEAGALKYRGSSGTVTTLGSA